jgi:hypothetical protein
MAKQHQEHQSTYNAPDSSKDIVMANTGHTAPKSKKSNGYPHFTSTSLQTSC